MTPAELKAARRELGLNKVEMAQALKTKYRTYVPWDRGTTPIPGAVEVAVGLLLEKDRRFMQSLLVETR